MLTAASLVQISLLYVCIIGCRVIVVENFNGVYCCKVIVEILLVCFFFFLINFQCRVDGLCAFH